MKDDHDTGFTYLTAYVRLPRTASKVSAGNRFPKSYKHIPVVVLNEFRLLVYFYPAISENWGRKCQLTYLQVDRPAALLTLHNGIFHTHLDIGRGVKVRRGS